MIEQPSILIVEADILVRHPLAAYLRECGYKVAEALNTEEALALLAANQLRIEIVLADAKGEKTSGDSFTLASWVRANRKEIDVILTGTVAKATQKAGELCEDGPALTKPYDHKNLLEAIRRSLAARERNHR